MAKIQFYIQAFQWGNLRILEKKKRKFLLVGRKGERKRKKKEDAANKLQILQNARAYTIYFIDRICFLFVFLRKKKKKKKEQELQN